MGTSEYTYRIILTVWQTKLIRYSRDSTGRYDYWITVLPSLCNCFDEVRLDSEMSDTPSLSAVTQPLTPAAESAVNSLTEMLGAITTVSITTANLPENSSLCDRHRVVELSEAGTDDHILVAIFLFFQNQIRTYQIYYRSGGEVVLFFRTTSYLLPVMFATAIGKTVIVEPRRNVPESLYYLWCEDYSTAIAYVASRALWVVERVGYWLSHRIVVLSPSMVTHLGLESYEQKIYKNGAWYIDLAEFYPTQPYENRELCAGCVGRLSEKKGIRELVRIVSTLPDDVPFVFVGDGPLGPWVETELSKKVEDGVVEITGWVDHSEVSTQLSRLKLLLLSSQTERLSITLFESMACGTPVYAKPVAGVPDVIEPGGAGCRLKESPRKSPIASHDCCTKIYQTFLNSLTSSPQQAIVSKQPLIVTTRYS